MTNPPPIISTGNAKAAYMGVPDLPMSDGLRAIFSEAIGKPIPKEDLSDSMTIGSRRVSLLWRPNNFRRKVAVSTIFDSGRKCVESHYPQCIVSKKQLITIREYPDIVLQIGRECVTGIWCQRIINGHKETFHVESDNPDGLKEWMNLKKDEIKNRIDAAINDFLSVTGIRRQGVIIWGRAEEWIKDEGYLSKLPRDMIVYQENYKKVYGEGIELTSWEGQDPRGSLDSYVDNMFLKKAAPGIEAEIAELRRELFCMMQKLAVKIDQLHHQPTPVSAEHRNQSKLHKWSSTTIGSSNEIMDIKPEDEGKL